MVEYIMQFNIPIVHISFAWIITKKSIHHDILLTLRKPSVFATEPTLGLTWARGHENPREETDDERSNSLNEKPNQVSFSSNVVGDNTYSHRQPPHPKTPRICRMPAARREPTMLLVLSAVQKKASLMGSSLDL
jgi:hypothetical protein